MGAAVAKLFAALAVGLSLTGNSLAEKSNCAVPFRLVLGMPFAKVLVNGRGPFIFLIDTGTSAEVIVTPAFAKKLALPLKGQTLLTNLGGSQSEVVNAVALESITVGGKQFFPRTAIVHRALSTAGSYDGILGFAFFRSEMLKLDYPRRCMTIMSDSALNVGDENVLALTLQRNGPMVNMEIPGAAVPAVIDTGGSGLILPAQEAGLVELAESTRVVVREDTQVGTNYLRGGEVLGRVGLGNHEFRNPFVTFTTSAPFGSLGASALQDFAITFDQRWGLVRFESRKRRHVVERSQLAPWHPSRAEVLSGRSMAGLGD